MNSEGDFESIEELLAKVKADPAGHPAGDYRLVIDRLAIAHEGDEFSRLADSAEAAFFEGRDRLELFVWSKAGEKPERLEFTKSFEADGIVFDEPSDMMFNFNNPVGACPMCEGFGRVQGVSEELVVPDPTLSVYDSCVAPWRGEKMSEWQKVFIHDAFQYDFPIHKPYADLTRAEKDLLWHGPKKAGRTTYEDFPQSTASSRCWKRTNTRYNTA